LKSSPHFKTHQLTSTINAPFRPWCMTIKCQCLNHYICTLIYLRFPKFSKPGKSSRNQEKVPDFDLHEKKFSVPALTAAGLPDMSWYMIPKPINVPNEHTMYQMVIKYPKCPWNIPSGHKTYQYFPI
jgi:hypothetical protein